MTNKLSWALAIYIAFVFLQSLAFKFSGSQETVIIFNTIGDWIAGIGFLAGIADSFKNYGGLTIGLIELVASGLVLYPTTRVYGAIIGLAVMSGAIFFHLGTPLGVDRVVDAAGNTDGGMLFFMACGVWLSCTGLIYINKVSKNPNTI